MAQISRLQHDVEVARSATLTVLADLVLAGFVLLAAGAALYDIGRWVGIW